MPDTGEGNELSDGYNLQQVWKKEYNANNVEITVEEIACLGHS